VVFGNAIGTARGDPCRRALLALAGLERARVDQLVAVRVPLGNAPILLEDRGQRDGPGSNHGRVASRETAVVQIEIGDAATCRLAPDEVI
jgi:hypothetical protein